MLLVLQRLCKKSKGRAIYTILSSLMLDINNQNMKYFIHLASSNVNFVSPTDVSKTICKTQKKSINNVNIKAQNLLTGFQSFGKHF